METEPIKVYCPECGRYLCETNKTLIAKNIKCGGCKKKQNIKVVYGSSTDSDIRYKFDTIEA